MKKSVITLFSFVLVCCYTSLTAQSLSCNNQVNISLDENCGILDLSVDAFLEGEDVDETLYELQILGINDIPVELNDANDDNYIGEYVGQCLTYNVIQLSDGNYCWGTICIEDKMVPTVDCGPCETPYLDDGVTLNPDCTFNCYEIWDLENLEDRQRSGNEVLPDFPDANDNCGDISPSDVQLVITPGPECGEELVTRNLLYQYVDFNGNIQSITCSQQFIFQSLDIISVGETVNGAWDGNADIFAANQGDRPLSSLYTPEHTVNLPCGASTDPADIAAFYDQDIPSLRDFDRENETPNLVEYNEGYPYAYPYVVQAGWTGRFHAKPIDNNICNIYSSYDDLAYDACAADCFGNSKIARTWTILDWCSADVITYTQVIKRIDVEGPAISGPNYTVSVDPWDCEASFTVPAPEHLLDACDYNATWGYSVQAGIPNNNGVVTLPKGITPITYNSYDCCGNTQSFVFYVTVEDNTAPVVVTNENLVIQLTNTQSGDGIAKLFATDVDNFSHDGCGPVHVEIRRNGNDWCNPGSNTTFNNDGHADDQDTDTDGGAYVLFCCEDAIDQDDNGVFFGIHDVLLRVWDDGDMDGVFGSAGDNYNESWTTVRVENKLNAIVVCPPDVELSCDQDFLDLDLTGRPFASEACGEVGCDDAPTDTPASKSSSIGPFVGETIPPYNPSCRTGAIKREWNCGGQTCTQWIIMRDTEDGTLDIEWPDNETIDCLELSYDEPEYSENICELSGVSLESDTFYLEAGACFTILNHWTVINWCDYDANDTDLNDVADLEDDGFVPGYYTHTQTVKLIDTEKPVLSVQDTCFAVNADCVGEDIAIHASATDNGDCASEWLKWRVSVDMNSDWDIDYTFSSFLPTNDPFYVAPTGGAAGESIYIGLPDGLPNGCSSEHRVSWTVLDGCGNETSGTSLFTIEDKKAPTPYMVNLSTALMQNGEVELWANDFDAGSFDNCTPEDFLEFSFDAEGTESSKVFDQDDLADSDDGLLSVPVYVWDLCGNTDFASVNLKLVDNGGDATANIAGRVATQNGVGLEGVTMSAISDQPGYPYTTKTEANGEYMFEYNPMANNYMISGAKNDEWLNGVTTLDIVLIQQHILNIRNLDNEFDLIAADASNDGNISAVDLIQIRKLILGIYAELPNNVSWKLLNPEMDDETMLADLTQDQMNQNFTAIKIADVNGTAVVGLASEQQTSERSRNALDLNIDKDVNNGQTTLTFSSDNFNDIYGFQFTLEGISEIVDLSSAALNINDSNVSLVNGALAMSWNATSAISTNQDLFSLTVKSDAPVLISDRITKSEAYSGENLEILNIEIKGTEGEFRNALAQNEPNPFKDQTAINFSLATEGLTQLTIFDVTGKVVYNTTANYAAGQHSVVLNKRDLVGASNVLYYKIDSGEFTDTKKMIILE